VAATCSLSAASKRLAIDSADFSALVHSIRSRSISMAARRSADMDRSCRGERTGDSKEAVHAAFLTQSQGRLPHSGFADAFDRAQAARRRAA